MLRKKQPKVSIIILNWNGWQDTIECLESFYQITYPNYEVIVVDNGSRDKSIKKIKDWARGKLNVKSEFFKYNPKNKPIKCFVYTKEELEKEKKAYLKKQKTNKLKNNKKLFILKCDKNYGFVEGNNLVMRQVLKEGISEYVLLLNNDIVVHKDFLGELVKVAESNPEIGIAGPKTYFYDYNRKKNVIAYIGNKLNSWIGQEIPLGSEQADHNQFNKNLKVDYLTGCAMLIKKSVMEKIGLLDLRYAPIYCEDSDFCIKAKKKNFLCIGVPTSMIWHKIARTVKGDAPLNIYLRTRNRFYLMKRIGSFNFFVFLLYFLFYKGIRNLGGFILRNRSLVKPFLFGIIDGLFQRDSSSRFSPN